MEELKWAVFNFTIAQPQNGLGVFWKQCVNFYLQGTLNQVVTELVTKLLWNNKN